MKKQIKKLILGLAFVMLAVCTMSMMSSAYYIGETFVQGPYTYTITTNTEDPTYIKVALDYIDKEALEKGLGYEVGDVIYDYYFPQYLGGYGADCKVTSISKYCFKDFDDVSEIFVPEWITSIATYAFWGTNAEKITICKGTENIILAERSLDTGALKELVLLRDIPSSLVYADRSKHVSPTIEKLTLLHATTDNATLKCLFKRYDGKYTMPETLKELTILEGETIVDNFFVGAVSDNYSKAWNPIEIINLPDTLKTIGKKAFYNCESLKELEIPEGVTHIDNFAFTYCRSLENIEIPNSVTYIGDCAFWYCYSLEEIIIPKSVNTVYWSSFISQRGEIEEAFKGRVILEDGVREIRASSTGSTTFDGSYHILDDLRGTFVIPCSVTYIQSIKNMFNNYSVISGHINSQAYSYTESIADWTVDDIIEEGEFIPLCNNYPSENPVVKDPTCTAEGYEEYMCAVCGASYQETIDATGHSYSETVVPPTCTSDGYTLYVCSSCNHSYTDNTVPATGHTVELIETVAPTCTSDGYELYDCAKCDDYDEYRVYLNSTGHKDDVRDGYCDNCGEIMQAVKDCDHICHKGGFSGFIYKILLIFWKIFKTNPVCDCGMAHY